MPSENENLKSEKAVFKWVQETPIGYFKNLPDEELKQIQNQLIAEVREVSRSLHWINAIMEIKHLDIATEESTEANYEKK